VDYLKNSPNEGDEASIVKGECFKRKNPVNWRASSPEKKLVNALSRKRKAGNEGRTNLKKRRRRSKQNTSAGNPAGIIIVREKPMTGKPKKASLFFEEGREGISTDGQRRRKASRSRIPGAELLGGGEVRSGESPSIL